MKRFGRLLNCILAFALVAVMVMTPAYASEKSDLEAENEELQEQIDEQKEKLEEIKSNISDIEEYIEALEEQISEIEAIISDYEDQQEQIEAEIEELSEEIAEEEDDLAQQYELMKLRIQYFYENGEVSTMAAFLESGSIAETLSSLQYSVELTDYDREQMEKIEAIITTIEEQKDEQEEKYAEIESLKEAQEEQQALVEEAKDEQETALAEANEEAYEIEELMDELEAEYEENKDRIDEIVAEYEAAAKAAASSSSSSSSSGSTYTYSGASMIWPLPSPYLANRISSYFGYRSVSVGSSYHKGIDIAAPSGTSIYAVLDGTVVASSYGSATGYYVILYHGSNLYTHYYHQCKASFLSVGDTVSQGDVIGYVGSTGASTGNHLHFGISIGAMWSGFVNPLSYLGVS